ncbi:queuine tRNA-ribosyltransferase accessory subunit 2 isoform X2 [Malaya genurostris]|uniref:queuine tRNA-ribosyltransferase accessory subunit 2 isoform X2 n=1 Tax=Malaya genurostris TaxID=325434 RepID=UPI0026F406D0|nr:queuine tRNA-ribosyltransferase accessory subunit 2 isoform X2 [Malaya genurostris]
MKYCLEKLTKCSGRLGNISRIDRLPKLKLQTPALVLHSKGGSIPHLSKEVFQSMNCGTNIVQYSLTNTEHMEEAIRACVLQDPAEFRQPSFHEKNLVPIYSRSGRTNFTVDRYMTLVEAFKPDIYVPLFDGDTYVDSSKKRVQKSVDRTETFLKQCLEVHRKSENLKNSTMLAPLVGGYNSDIRKKYYQFLSELDQDFSGYLLTGFHSNGSSATNVDLNPLLEVVSDQCEILPIEKPRFAFGAFNPLTILQLICRGVDIFDTSYAYLKTQQNRALVFSFNIDDNDVEERDTELDMKDPRWAQDFTGFISTCECLACSKHTRAYSHHLYNTREMLGPILLMIHNLHHFFEFFKTIQKHVSDDTVPDLINHLTKQKLIPFDEEEASKISNPNCHFVSSSALDTNELQSKKLKV